MTFEFNDKQKELIKEYRELITYGFKKLHEVSLDVRKIRGRKRVLYFMMGAMQSFSESILKLMGTEPVYEKPGESLLRSQLEIWLNMRFIYSSRSENKARLFLSDLIMESITFAKKHKALWEKYPHWKMEFGRIKKKDDWVKFISDNLKLLKSYRSKYKDKNVTKLPGLYDRTLAIDNYLKTLGTFSENNSLIGAMLSVASGIFLYLGASDFLPHIDEIKGSRLKHLMPLIIGALLMLVTLMAIPHSD